MALILSIETSTAVCSVALHEQGKLLALAELREPGAHAEKLMGLLEEVLVKAAKALSEVEAIAVSEGPGSYTGLRIGVSTAKGLAFALDKPLIGINTLRAMAAACPLEKGAQVVAVLDARRMEVYTQVFGEQLEEKTPIEALILEEGVFGTWLDQGKVFFIGDAVEKVKQVVDHPNAVFLSETDYSLSARTMGQLAFEKFKVQAFEDLAYFVPNYLKEFKALQSTKNPLLKP
jgi:tRNA threonylcarbamoyladenosine biosynthesis protein TsaB